MSFEDAKTQIDLAFTHEDSCGLAFENAFSGAMSLMWRVYCKDIASAGLVFTGIPFDQAVTHRLGARFFDPLLIREASTLQPNDPPYGWNGFDPLSEFEVVDYGDMVFDYEKIADVPDLVRQNIEKIIFKVLQR